jgi:hypothetical protein
MAFMTELDVVNDCLSTLGELPVNALDDDHNLIAAARRAFRTCNVREQAKDWWFNREIITLVRDVDDYIWTPADAIRCDPINKHLNLIQRGRRFYDPQNATYKMLNESVTCWLVRQIPYEDLPPSAQVLINISTSLKFMSAYDADSTKYRQLVADYQEAYSTMNSEHIRNSDNNLLEKHDTLRTLSRIRGYRNGRLLTPPYTGFEQG